MQLPHNVSLWKRELNGPPKTFDIVPLIPTRPADRALCTHLMCLSSFSSGRFRQTIALIKSLREEALYRGAFIEYHTIILHVKSVKAFHISISGDTRVKTSKEGTNVCSVDVTLVMLYMMVKDTENHMVLKCVGDWRY